MAALHHAASVPRPLWGLLFFVLTLLVAADAAAHGMRSGYVEIEEGERGTATMLVRTTVDSPTFSLRVEGCSADALAGSVVGDSGRTRAFLLRCDGELGGRMLSVDAFGALEEVSVLAQTADGATASTVLLPGGPTVELPRRRGALAAAWRYVALGLQHIGTGADHILFLVLLVLQLRAWRPVLLAETAFSVSHGLAFTATALGWVHLAPAPVEACIALSLLLLALDARPGEATMRGAQAAALALVFGVVHGLGFAGGLREVGMPDEHAAAALLGFGIGVELGQIAVVAALLLALRLMRSWRALRWVEPGAVVAAGSLAAFWLITRVVAIFQPEWAS